MHHIVESQEEVFAFLGDPAAHGGHAVERIDTHAACVFLAGGRVLKVKRAARFPFLDYSTREKRKAACEAELEVNRSYAPELYQGVVAITREADGRLALDGEGEAIDWAVEMHRFDENAILAERAKKGSIDASLADALGRVVAESHARAPIADAGAWLAALPRYIDDNDTELRERPQLFPPQEIEALTRDTRAALARVLPLLERRGKTGSIRRLHGDLHLGNIVLIDGRPVLFDAIEFDPVIASGDVLYDLAFLLMDLIERGFTAAANVVLNRYLAATNRNEDLDALAALPFFLSIRAAIRAKVTAARLEEADAMEAPEIERAARAYFDLARRPIASQPPRLVAVGGLSGTGKSALARALAPDILPTPGAVLLRSDVERKALFGKCETERLSIDAYTAEVTEKVYRALGDKARRVLAAGHSVIVDGVFARADERRAIARAAAEAGAAFKGFFLRADLAKRLARIGARGADASDADAKVARLQQDYEIGDLGDWEILDASGMPADTLQCARAALR